MEKSYSYSEVFVHTKKSLGIFSLTDAVNEEQESTHSSGVGTRHTFPLHTMSTVSVITNTLEILQISCECQRHYRSLQHAADVVNFTDSSYLLVGF